MNLIVLFKFNLDNFERFNNSQHNGKPKALNGTYNFYLVFLFSIKRYLLSIYVEN